MGNDERKALEKSIREEDILKAALAVFADKGYETATMDDVAQAAEFTKKTLYSYFLSKDEIFLRLMLRALTIMTGLFEKGFEAGNTGFDKIRNIGMAYISLYRDYPREYAILTSRRTPRPDAAPAAVIQALALKQRRMMELMTASFGAGLADGSIRPGTDPLLASLFVMGASAGVVELATGNAFLLEQQGGQSIHSFLEYAIDMLGQSFVNPDRKKSHPDKGVIL